MSYRLRSLAVLFFFLASLSTVFSGDRPAMVILPDDEAPQIWTFTILEPQSNGTTYPETGSYQYNAGRDAQVQAAPGSGWELSHWLLDDEKVGDANPITIACDGSGDFRALQAVIDEVNYQGTASGALEIDAVTASGIPFSWLENHGLPTDGSMDHEKIGASPFTVYEEWIAGTNPNDITDILLMTEPPEKGPYGFIVRWRSVADRTYTIERSHDLTADPQFETVAAGIQGIDGVSEYVDETAEGPGPFLYRVLVEGGYLVIDLSLGSNAQEYDVAFYPTASGVPLGVTHDRYKTTHLLLRRIPAGPFIMGSPEDELGRRSNEAQHQVTFTENYYIGVFQVTQKQWERVMGDWPSHFENLDYRDTRPLEFRSWDDIRGGTWPGEPAGSGQPAAGSFIQRLRERTGLSFDLPTEAQWEYACRAGTTTALNSGNNLTDIYECPNMDEVGRYYHNHPGGYSSSSGVDTSGGTAEVGSYQPNAWGLYDMHGNVWEWCLDWYMADPEGGKDPLGLESGSDRVLRGGSWFSSARVCRAASRGRDNPSSRYSNRGFRLVRAVQ